MASAKFQGNRFKIDGEIAKIMRSWLIIFNLTASIAFTTVSITPTIIIALLSLLSRY